MLTSDCGLSDKYALQPHPSTPSDTLPQNSTKSNRRVDETAVERYAKRFAHPAVKATIRHVADLGANFARIRARANVVNEIIKECRDTHVDGLDLRESARSSRRNAYRIAQDLCGVTMDDGRSHFDIVGLTICPSIIHVTAELQQEHAVREKKRKDAHRALKRKYDESPRAKELRLMRDRRAAYRRKVLVEYRAMLLSSERMPRNDRDRKQLEKSWSIIKKAEAQGEIDVTTAVPRWHTPPSQIAPQHQQNASLDRRTSYLQSNTGTAVHPPLVQQKELKKLTPPTGPDRDRTPEPCADPELGTQLFPQRELGREPSVFQSESFGDLFPDYHERFDAKADPTHEAYAEWASLESHSQARPSEPSTDHAVPVGTCGVGLENNFLLEEVGQAEGATGGDVKNTEAQNTDALFTSHTEARPDCLSGEEHARLSEDDRELYSAFAHRTYAARARIVTALRRKLGTPQVAQKQQAPADDAEKLARGQSLLRTSFGLTKEHCLQATDMHDRSTRAPAVYTPPPPLAVRGPRGDRNMLRVEVGERVVMLKWAVLDRHRIPSFLVARAAYHLRQKLSRHERVANMEGWLVSNARTYRDRGVLPNDIIGDPRPFEHDREAAETLAPQFAAHHQGPGDLRWR